MRVLVVALVIAGALIAIPAGAQQYQPYTPPPYVPYVPYGCPACDAAIQAETQYEQRRREQRRYEQMYDQMRQDRRRRQWFHEDSMQQQFQNTCSRYDPYCLRNFDQR